MSMARVERAAAAVMILGFCVAAGAQQTAPARPETLPAAPAATAPASMPAATPAPATAPATAPASPDHVKALLDAYDAARERTKFLAAAGVDNELDANEFQADQAKEGGFVRPFERWRNLLPYDKNASKTLDWTEAEAYRQNLRTKLLAAFDADKDARLLGEERDSANRALARGWSGEEPAAWAAGPGRPPWAGGGAPGVGGGAGAGGLAGGGPLGGGAARRRGPQWDRQELITRFDKDGDGQLSDEERQAALKDFEEQQRQETLKKYDTDGDGQLSAEETAAMREDMRRQAQPWKQLTDRLAARLFDADEDGQLTEQGKADAKEFQKKFEELGKDYDRRFNDLDGDGNVTPEERRQVQAEWRGQALRMMALGLQYMDADGDGKVSAEEREGFTERMRTGVEKWATKFIDKFDLDGDGKLSAEERADLLKGLKYNIDRRIEKAAPEGAGRLTPRQAITLIEDFAEEIGVAPKARTPATAPAQEE